MLEQKLEEVIKNPLVVMDKEVLIEAITGQLVKYKNYVTKFTDQIGRSY
jgi:hypothetical protein